MPELPEVDHVVRGLQSLVGQKIQRLMPGAHQPPSVAEIDSVGALMGAEITGIVRRGKWIVFETAISAVLVHLRLTGSLLLQKLADESPAHHRWTLLLSKSQLALADPRGFGTIAVHDAQSLPFFFDQRLGLEPTGPHFDGAYLQSKASRRRLAIKTVLLDQKVAAGAGNIYVDEALFTAKIDPHQRACDLTFGDYERVAAGLVAAIEGGLARGGSSVRNYMHTDGSVGTNQLYLNVYGRRGKPCSVCSRPLSYDKIGGRGTVWCTHCQPQKAT